MIKLLGIALVAALAVGGFWLLSGPSPAPIVAVVQVERADLASILTTNGRIEAAERFEIFGETAGRVSAVPVQVGGMVKQGQPLVHVAAPAAQSERRRAAARLDAAKARLKALEAGIPAPERMDLETRITAIEGSLNALRSDRDVTQRLVERQAAPRSELADLDRRILELENDRDALQQKLKRQPDPFALDSAAADVREAQAALDLADRQFSASILRAPAPGRLYSLAVRPGDYITPGSAVAKIAGNEQVTAFIFVDEPELGRVTLGAEAALTADAYPDHRWTCTVERLPSEIIELNTRRVGEIRCGVSGATDGLIPNLTVDVAIQTASASNAPSLPREAIQRGPDGEFVWTLGSDSTARRTPIQTGVRSADRVEVRSGVDVGHRVLLPAERTLAEGKAVQLAEPPTP